LLDFSFTYPYIYPHMEYRKETRYWAGIAVVAGAAGLLLPFVIVGNLLKYAWRIVESAVVGTYHTGRLLVVFVPDSIIEFDKQYGQKRLQKQQNNQ